MKIERNRFQGAAFSFKQEYLLGDPLPANVHKLRVQKELSASIPATSGPSHKFNLLFMGEGPFHPTRWGPHLEPGINTCVSMSHIAGHLWPSCFHRAKVCLAKSSISPGRQGGPPYLRQKCAARSVLSGRESLCPSCGSVFAWLACLAGSFSLCLFCLCACVSLGPWLCRYLCVCVFVSVLVWVCACIRVLAVFDVWCTFLEDNFSQKPLDASCYIVTKGKAVLGASAAPARKLQLFSISQVTAKKGSPDPGWGWVCNNGTERGFFRALLASCKLTLQRHVQEKHALQAPSENHLFWTIMQQECTKPARQICECECEACDEDVVTILLHHVA